MSAPQHNLADISLIDPSASVQQSSDFSSAFINSLGMIFATEIGDKTYRYFFD